MFYQIAIRAVGLLWHFWFHLELHGRENEPKEGGYILPATIVLQSIPMIVCQGIRHSEIHFRQKRNYLIFLYSSMFTVGSMLSQFPVEAEI